MIETRTHAVLSRRCYLLISMHLQKEKFAELSISEETPILWLHGSRNLSELGFLLWNFLKSKVDRSKSSTIDEPKKYSEQFIYIKHVVKNCLLRV